MTTEQNPLAWVTAAMGALASYEADYGESLPDDHELGRIDDSRGSPSFRIRVGHIRQLAAIARKAGAQESVAEQWRAMDAEEGPRTGWTHMGLGDMRGWQKLEEQEPQRFSIERRSLYTHPAPAQEPVAVAAEGWQEDPASDERWNDGCDFAMQQLCVVLGVEQENVHWDAATETVDGDVQAVLRNILEAAFGEDWPGPSASPVSPPTESGEVERLREALRVIAEPIGDGARIGDPWSFYADLQAVAREALALTPPAGEG